MLEIVRRGGDKGGGGGGGGGGKGISHDGRTQQINNGWTNYKHKIK